MAWTDALAADPDDAAAWTSRAWVLMRLGRWDSAAADLESPLHAADERP